MTVRVTRRWELPVQPAAVLAALRSRDVVERRCRADGLQAQLQAHEVSTDGVRIVTATTVPVDWLPGVVAARVAAAPSVERTEVWSAAAPGAGAGSGAGREVRSQLSFSFSALPVPVPVTVSGAARLVPKRGGSGFEVTVEIEVGLPVVGRLVEGSLAPRIESMLDVEARFYATLRP